MQLPTRWQGSNDVVSEEELTIMAETTLAVDPRVVTGKKVKALRRQGLVPAHLYGKDTDSLSLQAQTDEVINVIKTAGRNAIINLEISGEGEPRPVVLRGVQQHPITDELLHVDFFQISLTEMLTADVPVVTVGEPPAVSVYAGVLLQSLDHIQVEALPMNIPQSIEVDISVLEELDDALFVRDLKVPAGLTVLSAPDQVVVKVSPPKVEAEIEEEELAEDEEGEEGEEGAEEGEEGEEGSTDGEQDN